MECLLARLRTRSNDSAELGLTGRNYSGNSEAAGIAVQARNAMLVAASGGVL